MQAKTVLVGAAIVAMSSMGCGSHNSGEPCSSFVAKIDECEGPSTAGLQADVDSCREIYAASSPQCQTAITATAKCISGLSCSAYEAEDGPCATDIESVVNLCDPNTSMNTTSAAVRTRKLFRP